MFGFGLDQYNDQEQLKVRFTILMTFKQLFESCQKHQSPKDEWNKNIAWFKTMMTAVYKGEQDRQMADNGQAYIRSIEAQAKQKAKALDEAVDGFLAFYDIKLVPFYCA